LLYASFRPRLAAVALAFSLALHLHQVGRGTCTPKLLNMPSTRLNRYAVVMRLVQAVHPGSIWLSVEVLFIE
jgi:hypothetical protein